MKLWLTVLITFLSLNSFAEFNRISSGDKITRKQAIKLTNDSILETNFIRIERSARDGKCYTEGFEIKDKDLTFTTLIKLGYEVTSDERGGYLITWCD